MRKGYVYFLRAEEGVGRVKIGYSTAPESRLKAMADWSPVKLSLVYQEDGGELLEKALHRHFADCRVHGEWFSPTPRLLAFIDQLQHGATISDLIEETPSATALGPLGQALERAIALAGGQSRLARRLGVSQATVWYWLHKNGRAPAEHANAISEASGGEVSKSDLRPDLWPGPKAGEAA